MEFTTRYLGLELSNPLVPSASPLSQSVESAKELEDAGASAIVMYSLFEEALVLEENGKLFALVYPDLEAADAKGFSEADLRQKMEENRQTLNKRLPAYSTISKIGLYPEEFEKTPTRKIKRFLYNMSHLET